MLELHFDAEGIRGLSSQAGRLADDLQSIQRTWMTRTDDATNALGLGVLVTAFDAMRTAWNEQFTVYVDVVSKLSERLGRTAANYQDAETANTRSAQSVG
jgi:uncharacterized protein YukE